MKKRREPRSAAPSPLQGEQRINKVLAGAGLGSRRQVDELIEQGRVEIDGKTVQQVGVKVNPDQSIITVDGEPLRKHRPVYFALHKPEGVLCTNRDPQGRTRVVDMVPNQSRLFPVGRLDASSTGLILLTNDGELSQRLTHPRHGVPKRYAVTVAGQVELDSLRRLQRGIHLAEGRARVDQAKLKRVRKGCSELEITLSEGKNREIRRVLARLGHKVLSLKRIGIGPLKLGDLPEGAYRPLGTSEVEGLYDAVDAIKRARKEERKERRKASAETPKKPRSQKSLPERVRSHQDESHEEILHQNDMEILVKDSAMEHDEDWLPPRNQRLGAVIGDEPAVHADQPPTQRKSARRPPRPPSPTARAKRPGVSRKASKQRPRTVGQKPGSFSGKKPKRRGK
jgi:23S rRNA pseudouridine2605 synthase